MASTSADITTDYLVIGGGFCGLSFVDELLTRTSATITLVDKRDAPGGHWNDAYPFVKLHAPGTIYGVESRELCDFRIDQHGPNKGYLSLSSGPEILSYCHLLMQQRFLPSGRVTYLPSTQYEDDGSLRGVHSGKKLTVEVTKRVVIATWGTNVIPLTHTRSFTTAPNATCIPPNDLTRLASQHKHFTVMGGGKTGVDACMWLLSNGVDPDRLRWIIPNDYWYVNRAKTQNLPEWFNDIFTSLAQRNEAIATATDAADLGFRLEKCDFWHRLDPNVEPVNFHAALVSKGELAELRKIKDVVRKGYVTGIGPDRVSLTKGTIEAPKDSLYIDCTACAIPDIPLVPIFQPGKIIVQLVRSPMAALSSHLIAYVETLPMSDEERNALIKPIPFSKSLQDHPLELLTDMQNRYRLSKVPETRRWLVHSRLEGFSKLAASTGPNDTEKRAILRRVQQGLIGASMNLSKLVEASARPRL